MRFPGVTLLRSAGIGEPSAAVLVYPAHRGNLNDHCQHDQDRTVRSHGDRLSVVPSMSSSFIGSVASSGESSAISWSVTPEYIHQPN